MYQNLIVNSPLEQFEIINLISLNAPIFGYINISLTNLALYCIIVLILILSLHIYANNNNKLVPSKWSIVLESSYASINSMVREQIGNSNEIFLPFIYTLFFFENMMASFDADRACTGIKTVSKWFQIVPPCFKGLRDA